MDYSIRPATVADLALCGPAAEKFYASSRHLRGFELSRFVAFWTALLDSGMGVIFLVWHDGAIAGALGAMDYPEPYSGESVATEFFWFVDPEHRGAGTDLYRNFENWARERKCSQIRMAFLHDSMPEKLAVVYRRWGYTPIETNWAKDLTHAS